MGRAEGSVCRSTLTGRSRHSRSASTVASVERPLRRLRQMPIEFINVDLEIESATHAPFQTLLQSFEQSVVFLRRTDCFAAVELAAQPADASDAIARFGRLISRLPPNARAEWDACHSRVMDIGLRGRGRIGARGVSLSAGAIRALVATRCTLSFTLYDAVRPKLAGARMERRSDDDPR